jgi:hypothetical protein
MRASWSTLTWLCLIVCLLGCKGTHSRPASVPSSAVWVDNTFVDCSVERQSSADHCTVYKDDTGEILAEGLFVLKSSHLAAEKSELHYAAFGERGIYLDDLRILVQRTASLRDPSHRIIDERLKTLASKGGTDVLACTNTAAGKADVYTECALSAFARGRPFWVRYYQPDGPACFVYSGFAGNGSGTVYSVFYSHWDCVEIEDTQGGQVMDNNQTLVVVCPKPTSLRKMENGELTCGGPVN